MGKVDDRVKWLLFVLKFIGKCDDENDDVLLSLEVVIWDEFLS